MKQGLLVALFLLLITSNTQAALIQYTYDVDTYQLDQFGSEYVRDVQPGQILMLVDSVEESITQLKYTSVFASLEWNNPFKPHVSAYQVGPNYPIYYGLGSILQINENNDFAISLEVSVYKSEGAVFEHLERIWLAESVFNFTIPDDHYDYSAHVYRAEKRIISVDEPATLALMLAGLAMIIRRRKTRRY